MKIIAFDTETFLIAPGRPAPPLVCASFCELLQSPTLFHARDGSAQARWLDAVKDPGTILVGHNVVYDLAVMVAACRDQEDALRAVFDALEKGRIRDTLTRQRIFHIRKGDLQHLKRGSLTLASMSKMYLGEEMKKGEDTWRLRYSELADVPLEAWPHDASHYAKHDAQQTLRVFFAQHELFERMKYLGKEEHSCRDEVFQLRAAFALQLMQTWGMRTDPERVAALEKELLSDIRGYTSTLQDVGVVRSDGSQNNAMLADRIVAAYRTLGREVPRTEKGAVSSSKDTLENVVDIDPVLRTVYQRKHLEKMLGTFVEPAKTGTVHPITANFNPLLASTRTSCRGPNLQNLPKKAGVRECFVPRAGFVFCDADYSTLEMRTFAQIMHELRLPGHLRQALIDGKDPHSMLGATLLNIPEETFHARRKAGDKEADQYRSISKCFHPDVEFLTPEGWRTFDRLEGLPIAQASPVEGECRLSWAQPFNLFEEQAAELVHLRNEGIDLQVTPDHRMLAFKRNGSPSVVKPADMTRMRGWWNAGVMEDGPDTVAVDETLLRLAVATQADGSRMGSHGIRFGFSKQRKIDRFRSLFADFILSESTREVEGVPVTYFSVGAERGKAVWDLLTEEKTFPWSWTRLSRRCREVVLDEVRHWDSTVIRGGHAARFNSVEGDNIEVLQTLASITGRKTRRGATHPSGNPSHRLCHSLTVRDKATTRGGNVDTTVLPYNGRVVCLSVPSSFVLVRQNGVPVITGQCGNFGYMGGLGAPKFVAYVKQFGMTISLETAQSIKAGWMKRWETAGYFKWVNSLIDENTQRGSVQLSSGIIRGGCTYTVACNTPFQSRAAYGAKEALWNIARETYLDRSSDLYGSRNVNFIHDEMLLEVPEGHGSPAAARVKQIMEESMGVWTPDVPQSVSPVLMRCWNKEAKPVLDDEGNLVPWDTEEAA